jgi:DNA-binding transcriptional LysR family regulator
MISLRPGHPTAGKSRLEQKSDRLSLITCFVAAAEHLSFVQAAAATGFTASTITRKISRLESLLKLRLFERTTRKVMLTEAGRLYFEKCTEALDRLDEADQLIEVMNSEPRGLFRLSLPVALGNRHLSRAVLEFQELYRDIVVEANLSDDYVDLIDGGYDAAIRIGHLPNSTLIIRKIANNRRILVAAPGYLERTGWPQHPDDLIQHNCISFSRYSAEGRVWNLGSDKEECSVNIAGNFVSDSSEAIYHAVLRGHGIGLVATYICMDDVQSGLVQQVLPEWRSLPDAGIYAVFPSRKHMSPKIRAFVNFMSNRFVDAPWNFQ